MVSLASIDHLS